MEKPDSPWKPSEAALELEFQRKSLEDAHTFLKTFARDNNITYVIEKKPDSILLLPQEGDFDLLREYIKKNLEALNGMLGHHNKAYQFVIEDQRGGVLIQAKDKKR